MSSNIISLGIYFFTLLLTGSEARNLIEKRNIFNGWIYFLDQLLKLENSTILQHFMEEEDFQILKQKYQDLTRNDITEGIFLITSLVLLPTLTVYTTTFMCLDFFMSQFAPQYHEVLKGNIEFLKQLPYNFLYDNTLGKLIGLIDRYQFFIVKAKQFFQNLTTGKIQKIDYEFSLDLLKALCSISFLMLSLNYFDLEEVTDVFLEEKPFVSVNNLFELKKTNLKTKIVGLIEFSGFWILECFNALVLDAREVHPFWIFSGGIGIFQICLFGKGLTGGSEIYQLIGYHHKKLITSKFVCNFLYFFSQLKNLSCQYGEFNHVMLNFSESIVSMVVNIIYSGLPKLTPAFIDYLPYWSLFNTNKTKSYFFYMLKQVSTTIIAGIALIKINGFESLKKVGLMIRGFNTVGINKEYILFKDFIVTTSMFFGVFNWILTELMGFFFSNIIYTWEDFFTIYKRY